MPLKFTSLCYFFLVQTDFGYGHRTGDTPDCTGPGVLPPREDFPH
uniref:Uncharacterized protein n=1 Tax=Anguilla anguilla TaxID=7936 RepID=A0A0E9RF40_ANGAN